MEEREKIEGEGWGREKGELKKRIWREEGRVRKKDWGRKRKG